MYTSATTIVFMILAVAAFLGLILLHLGRRRERSERCAYLLAERENARQAEQLAAMRAELAELERTRNLF